MDGVEEWEIERGWRIDGVEKRVGMRGRMETCGRQ